jgi:hypothetical protein
VDDVAILEVDSRQRAAHLGAELDLLDRRELTKEAEPRLHHPRERLAYDHLRNRRGQRRYRSVAPAIEISQRCRRKTSDGKRRNGAAK